MNHFESIVCQLSPPAIQADLVSLCQFCQSGSALLWRRPPTGRAARCILFFAATTGKLYGSAHRACRALVPWRTNFSILLETLVDLKDGCGNRLMEVRDRGRSNPGSRVLCSSSSPQYCFFLNLLLLSLLCATQWI